MEVYLGSIRCFIVALAGLMLLAAAAHAADAKWMIPQSLAAMRMKDHQPATKPVGADPLENTWTCYRTSFDLPAAPAWSTVRIAADTKYWLWVNGELAVFDGGLERGPTRTDGYVDVVDVGPWLKKGKNTIAILSCYFGKEGFSHISSGMPGLYVDSNMLPVHSGAGWKAMVHPAFGKTRKPTPNFRLAESNVRFDAGKDIAGWTKAAFDDSSWPAASEMGEALCAVGQNDRSADAVVSVFATAGVRERERTAARRRRQADLGNAALRCAGDALLENRRAGRPDHWHSNRYIHHRRRNGANANTSPAGVQEFEMPAWMSGFKVIYKIPAGVKILSLKYRESGYDTDLAGKFHCDDPFFDAIWKKAKRTLYVNMRDNYSDCPDRERAQWWGDIVNDLCEASYGLGKSAHLLARRDFWSWRRGSGRMGCCCADSGGELGQGTAAADAGDGGMVWGVDVLPAQR